MLTERVRVCAVGQYVARTFLERWERHNTYDDLPFPGRIPFSSSYITERVANAAECIECSDDSDY